MLINECSTMSINILKKLKAEIELNKSTRFDDSKATKKESNDANSVNITCSPSLYNDMNILSFSYRECDFNKIHPLGSIPTLCYIPGVFTSDDELKILSAIQAEGHQNNKWKNLKTRRLQLWETSSADHSSCGFPHWLQNLCNILVELRIFGQDTVTPNHVLINDYEKGEGILHHTDGPSYYPKVAILSLNSSCIMTFRKRLDSSAIGTTFSGDLFSVVLRPKSLLIFSDDIYEHYMHGIESNVDYDIVGMKHGSVENKGNSTSESSDSTSVFNSVCHPETASSQSVDVMDNHLVCLNMREADVQVGDMIERGARTSLTFLHKLQGKESDVK